MDWLLWVLAVVAGLLALGAGLAWRPVRAAWRESRFIEACRDFHYQRERLETKFVQLGTLRAKPAAPRWSDCDFDDGVAYARNRSTGELSAFVAVTIEVSSDTPDMPHGIPGDVGNLRSATAVFRFTGSHWDTDGRAIFNLSPAEAIHYYRRDLEMIGHEAAQRS
ncbi:MAG: hypothetical protein ACYTG0_29905 [Planctomycetota bacterium]|jgi:hypothetical protein